MNNRIIAQNEEIVIGTDVHVKEHQVAVVRQDGVLLKNARIKANKKSWESLLERLPGCGITVVYEAGLTGYGLYDLIVGMGHRAVVVAPERHVGVKTDKRDSQSGSCGSGEACRSEDGQEGLAEHSERLPREESESGGCAEL